MPIRIVEDENNDSPQNDNQTNNSSSGGGGRGGFGGGGMGGILMSLLPILLKNPKLLILVAILGGGYYMFSGGCGGSSNMSQAFSNFNKGATLDPKVFDEAEVFEPLSPEGNTLPERVSLEKYAPKRLNQGQQGSCVGWGSSYAARTILQSIATGKDPNSVAFSPSFLYNQIGLEGCQGSYVQRAMENLTQVGDLPFTQFAYDENSCDKKPTVAERSAAAAFRMKGANRLTKNGDDQTLDLLAMKQNIAQGAPVVIGMMVGGSFMQEMMGTKVWLPTANDYEMSGFGGHCMCVIGYDDYLEGGCFQLMNSWGEEWGEKGLAWVRYKDFIHFAKEAYGVYPMGRADVVQTQNFKVNVGLLSNASKQLINFKAITNNVFETTTPLNKGDKFKIQIQNSAECYTYVFGQETDGSSYILFPYTPKHSPYCGIVGTRVFPKDYSLQADDKGNKDYMAVVITKQPLDYKKLNDAINATKKTTYAEKVNTVLAAELANIKYTVTNTINIDAEGNGKNAAAFILIINKK